MYVNALSAAWTGFSEHPFAHNLCPTTQACMIWRFVHVISGGYITRLIIKLLLGGSDCFWRWKKPCAVRLALFILFGVFVLLTLFSTKWTNTIHTHTQHTHASRTLKPSEHGVYGAGSLDHFAAHSVYYKCVVAVSRPTQRLTQKQLFFVVCICVANAHIHSSQY